MDLLGRWCVILFFFKQKTAYEIKECDWSSDVCSSELFWGINQETDRLNGMVGNILALSRLEADAWRPDREMTGLEDLLEATLDSFGTPERQRIRIGRTGEADEVWVDPVQIVEVLHNLLDNALKYSPHESLVELRASSRGEYLVLEVADRGPGLPEGGAERVFE